MKMMKKSRIETMMNVEMKIQRSIKHEGMGVHICYCGNKVKTGQTYYVPIITQTDRYGKLTEDNTCCSTKCAQKWLANMLKVVPIE